MAAAGTGVQLADGSTNILPVGSPDDVRAAWRLHAGLVRRSLERALLPGLGHASRAPADPLPGQLRLLPRGISPSRPAAVGLRRQRPTQGSWTSRPPRGHWPATSTAACACGALDEAELDQPAPAWMASALAALARPKSDTEHLTDSEGVHGDHHLLRPARRAARPDRPAHRSRHVHRGVRGDPARRHARHRHQQSAVLGRHPALGDRPAAVRLRRDVLPVHRRGRLRAAAATGPSSTRRPRACCSSSRGRCASPSATREHLLDAGGYAFLPPGDLDRAQRWQRAGLRFHWIRKAYQARRRTGGSAAFVTNERDVEPIPMPGTDGRWVTSRFVDPADSGTTCTSTSSPSIPAP